MLTKLDEKINEIKKSLLNESIDEDLFNKILACKSLDDLKEAVDSIFEAYTDCDGYINYHNAFDFETDLQRPPLN